MDKILIAILIIGLAFFMVVSSGCSTQPMPNININTTATDDNGVCAGDAKVTIVIDNDKVYIGDEGAINDDDGGQTPTLGL